jgi:hypothetical protein
MAKLIFAALLKIRESFQKMGQALFQRMRRADGKPKYVSPMMARRILMTAAVVFFAAVLISQILTRDRFVNHSFDDYQKEVTSDGGTRPRDFNGRALFNRNPLTDLGQGNDPIKSLESVGTGRLEDGGGPSANTRTVEAGALPSASDCFAVIEKAKAAEKLSITERMRLESCVKNNVVPLSDADKSMLRALSSSDLSQAERDAIVRTMGGKGSESDRGVTELASASIDPDKQGLLKEGVNAEYKGQGVDLENNEVRGLSKTIADKASAFGPALEGVQKILGGASPDEKQKANLLEAIRDVKGGDNAALENPNLSPDKEKAILALAQDIQDRSDKITELEKQLADAQVSARSAADKLVQGLALSKVEQAALDNMSSIRKELDQLKAAQEKRQRALIEITSRLQKTVAQAALTIQKTIPSGVFEGYADFEQVDCKNIKPLPVKVGKKGHKPDEIGPDGKRVAKMNVKAKPAYNVYRNDRVEDEIKRNGVEYEGKRLDISKYTEQNIKVSELFVMQGSADKAITLSPETKIAAVLDSEIMVSGNGGAQSVRIKILQDVHDAKNRNIVIPKNSVAVGRTAGFDEQTGIMEFTFDKVSIGSGQLAQVNLRVGSGDGTMGLKGQIRDTRGRYLLGAFVTAFSAGALNFVSQNVVSQYQQSQNAAVALTGAAYSGGADVAQRIASMYANDLQNASPIFYCPRGIPLVLFPE